MDLSQLESLSPEEQEAFMNMLLEGPALESPTNEYDFVNNGGQHELGYGVVIAGGCLALISVLLRARSRYLTKQIHIEDGILIVGLVR
jgi:hypothetical protein